MLISFHDMINFNYFELFCKKLFTSSRNALELKL